VNTFYLIGLLGQIGSGKTTVLKMLAQLGACTIDADMLAHLTMQRGTPTWTAIVKTFGASVLKPDGQIDRRKLGGLVFAKPEALQQLEAIVHPAVRTLTQDLLRANPKPVVVIEAIKLVEAGMHEWCDALWAIDCTPATQIERVMRTRNLSQAEAEARLAAQGSFEEKYKLANVIIDNAGDKKATLRQVEKAFRAIRPETARDKREWLFGVPREPEVQTEEVAPPAITEETTAPPLPDWAKERPAVRVVTRQKTAPPTTGGKPGIISPPTPDWAKSKTEVEVRRTRRSDLEMLSVALATKENRTKPLSREETLKRFGERGYRIAIADKKIVALAAWEAENLVASVREMWTESPDIAALALPRLFELIESEAGELLCEIVLLMIPNSASAHIVGQVRAAGYQPQDFKTLHKLWQQAVQDRMQPGDELWGKKLREVAVKPF